MWCLLAGGRPPKATVLYALVSCCVGPGFDFADFEMVRQQLESKRPVLPHPELI
jgi:predicted cupin superfamily sugar epimerase